MKYLKMSLSLLLFVLTSIACSQEEPPKTFSIDSQKVFSLRQAYLKGELNDDAFIKATIQKAEELMDFKPMSVVDKDAVPPSGDKHDFLSMGPYWWPDPTKPDGKPYIRKDGERNPETQNYKDDVNQNKVIAAVETLTLAFYFSGEEKYAEKAAHLLRVWYLDEETKMNPNLNYAQFIPGITDGRGIGIIATRTYQKLVDVLGLLEKSKAWTKKDNDAMRDWFNEYFVWLTTSKNGVDESKEKNNHGTWYDVQAAALAMYVGNNEFAKNILEKAKAERIAHQINAEGKQPLELERTDSWHYSTFNLIGIYYLAVLGDRVGVNLWDYTSEEGASLRKALDYLLPYVNNFDKWEYKVLRGYDIESLYPLLVLAQSKYDSEVYGNWIKKIYNDHIPVSIETLYY